MGGCPQPTPFLSTSFLPHLYPAFSLHVFGIRFGSLTPPRPPYFSYFFLELIVVYLSLLLSPSLTSFPFLSHSFSVFFAPSSSSSMPSPLRGWTTLTICLRRSIGWMEIGSGAPRDTTKEYERKEGTSEANSIVLVVKVGVGGEKNNRKRICCLLVQPHLWYMLSSYSFFVLITAIDTALDDPLRKSSWCSVLLLASK